MKIKIHDNFNLLVAMFIYNRRNNELVIFSNSIKIAISPKFSNMENQYSNSNVQNISYWN